MQNSGNKILVSTAPFLKDVSTTPGIMKSVIYSLLPILLASIYFFGLSAILVSITAVVSCVFAEWLFGRNGLNSIQDGSAVLTGLLLAFTLPPGFPLWMVFVGGIVAIGLGKSIWGGLGQNIFNPALLGRAFLQAAFPTAITTWTPTTGLSLSVFESNLALPFLKSTGVDAYSSATPLAQSKFAGISTGNMELFIGNISGSLGETSAVILILCGLYLLVRRIIDWRIPFSILSSVYIFSWIIHLINPAVYPDPVFMLLSGGLLIGAFFMATDYVTSPMTPTGVWVFGVGIGLLVVLIRLWGGLPEGVMYAILLMNAATPLINRYSRIRTYGHQ